MFDDWHRPAWQVLSAAAACAAAALVSAPAAVAAAPPNDAFAAAQPLTGVPIAVSGSNLDATLEPGEPLVDEGGGASVWFTWSPPAPGVYQFDTCDSDFDTVLGVYTGNTLAGLTRVAVNDDSCGLGSRVRVRAAGVIHRIAVGGYDGDQGAFRLAISELHPPANDNFAAAHPLAGPLPLAAAGTTVDALLEPGEPWHGDGSVWFAWTPAATGAYRIETCGSATDAAPFVYSGNAVDSLSNRAPSGPWPCPGSTGAFAVFRAAAGEPLRIAVGPGEGATSGPFTLRIAPEPAPANDAFAAAQPVNGAAWEIEGIALTATSEAGEPAHGGAAAVRTVWIRWTAPVSDRYQLVASGNVTLGLYTGAALSSLAPVPSMYDPEVGVMWFTATAGREYRIAVNWQENPLNDAGRFSLAANRAGLTAAPISLQFAPQAVNTISATNVITLSTTPGALVTLPFSVSVRGPHATDFLKVSDDCTDDQAQRCSVGLRFAPSATGVRTAALAVETWLGTYTLPLSGTGTQTTGEPLPRPAPSTPPPAGQPPSTPPPAGQPAAIRGRASCALRTNTRRGAVVRCTVTRTPAANGTVTGTLRRGTATPARGSRQLRAGKATLLLKSRRKLTRGRYRISLSITVRGARPLKLTRNLRIG